MSFTKIPRTLLNTSVSDSGDATAITIDSSENVGIGTTSPTEKLTVAGAITATGALADDRTSTAAMDFSSGVTRFVSYGASGTGGIFAFRTASGGVSSTERMRITSDGKVGIGQTSPSAALHITGSGDTKMIIESGSDEQSITGHSGGLNYDVVSGDNHTFLVNGTDVAAVNANGIGIGIMNPNEKLEISGGNFGFNLGTGNLGNRYILVNSGTGNDGGFVFKRANTNRWQQTIASGDDDNMWFYSYGTNNSVLTLDRSHGHVNMQNQPSFQANAPAVTNGGGNTIVFGGVGHNTGSHYNTSNGRFTAPIAGKYLFTFSILMDPSSTTSYTRILFAVNGTESTSYGDTLSQYNSASTSNYYSAEASVILSLGANDYVTLENHGTDPTYGTQYGSFCGQLLS